MRSFAWAVWLALALVGCDEPVDTDVVEASARHPLDDPAFAFCHDEDGSDDEIRQWCRLVDDAPDDLCEGLRARCATLPTDVDSDVTPDGGCNQSNEGASSGGSPKGVEAPKSPPPDLGGGVSSMAAQGLGQVVRWTLALLLAAAVVGVLVLVVRLFMSWVGKPKSKRGTPTPQHVVQVALLDTVEHDEVPDLPSERLLDSARRALQEGRQHDAVLLARGASLRGLAEKGEIRLHRSRTDREYVRSLRKKRERQSTLRLVIRAVEQVRWGGRALDAEAARAAVDAAGKLIVVLLAFVGLFWASPSSAGGDYAPDGSAALKTVFEQHGFEAQWRLRSVREIEDEVDVLVLDAVTVGMAEEDWQAVRAWVVRGGVLLVAGDAQLEGIGELVYRPGTPWMASSARSLGLAMPVHPTSVTHCFDNPGGLVWVRLGDTDCAMVQAISLGDGGIVALSDHKVLLNGSFLSPDNVAFVGGVLLVGEAQGLWGFDKQAPLLELATIAGESTSSPLGSLLNARMLPLVGQLMFLLIVVGLWKGWPFARLRDPPEAGRLDFADHVRALGERHLSVGASRHVARSAAELALLRVGSVALHAAAVRAGHTAEEATKFVSDLEALVESPQGPDSPGDIQLMEELWRIRQSR